MKRILLAAVLVLGPVLGAGRAFAWGGAGHMLIAAEAYRQLTPQSKAQVIDVLKAHPEFTKWKSSYRPSSTVDLAAYLFMKCSTWPDEIRGADNPYAHANWHFIEYPLRPPDFKFEADSRPLDNVLYGIVQCEKNLADPNADRVLRAVYLSYLVHLVADVHQPLHCGSLYEPGYPKGDRDGNEFYVKPNQKPQRLHGFWDGLLGGAENPSAEWKYAITLQDQFPRGDLTELQSDPTPERWSLASRQLAIEKAYLNGSLPGSRVAADAPPLPAGYAKTAKTIAEHQAVLAGYRLADEIRRFLSDDNAPPLTDEYTTLATEADLAPRIGASQAAAHYDEDLVVTGHVARVTVNSDMTFLSIDKPYPHSPLTVVIFESNLEAFGDARKFEGTDVELSGTISEYQGKPEIILDRPDQIKIIGDK